MSVFYNQPGLYPRRKLVAGVKKDDVEYKLSHEMYRDSPMIHMRYIHYNYRNACPRQHAEQNR